MRWIWMALGALVMACPAYLTGDLMGGWEAAATASQRAQVLVAEAQRDAAHRDLMLVQDAAERATKTAEENRDAALAADDRARGYEAALAARPGDNHCSVTDGDLEWLRGPSSAGSAGAPPPTR